MNVLTSLELTRARNLPATLLLRYTYFVNYARGGGGGGGGGGITLKPLNSGGSMEGTNDTS